MWCRVIWQYGSPISSPRDRLTGCLRKGIIPSSFNWVVVVLAACVPLLYFRNKTTWSATVFSITLKNGIVRHCSCLFPCQFHCTPLLLLPFTASSIVRHCCSCLFPCQFHCTPLLLLPFPLSVPLYTIAALAFHCQFHCSPLLLLPFFPCQFFPHNSSQSDCSWSMTALVA